MSKALEIILSKESTLSLMGVIIGSIFELIFCVFCFMVVAFSGGALANGGASKVVVKVLNYFLCLIPISCIVCAIVVIFAYSSGFGSNFYWLFAVPPALLVTYFIIIARLAR